jgi:preprotein translocase subunit SecF
MRSINTSLISVLPVIALLVVAVWLLGVGTLKDLALVQLIGIIIGTYSSIFFATPLLVTLRERTQLVATHTRRVLRRRSPGAGKISAKDADAAGPADDAAGDGGEPVDAEATAQTTRGAAVPTRASRASNTTAPSKPAPGARPAGSRHRRPTGKRNTGRQ